MDTKNFELTLDDFLLIDQQTILDTCSNPICSELLHSFLDIANAGSDTAMILAKLCAVRFSPNESKSPFQGYRIIDDKYGFLPRDFPDEIFVTLKDFYPKVIIPDLKARIADVIWTAKPNKLNTVDDAYSAIDAYIESAKKLIGLGINEHEYDIINRIKRALQLSKLFKRDNQRPDFFNKVSCLIKDELDKAIGGYYSRDLLELSLNAKITTDNDVVNISKNYAEKYLNEENFSIAIDFFSLAIKAASYLNDKDEESKLWRKMSDAYVKYSENQDSGMLSSSYILKAIECLDKVPNVRNERDKLYSLMRDYQKEIKYQMCEFVSDPIDLTEIINESKQIINGKDLFDTLFRFSCMLAQPTRFAKIQEEAKKDLGNGGLIYDFGTQYYDHDGMLVAKVPSALDIVELEGSPQLWSVMMKHLKMNHELIIQAKILPALENILFKYNINITSIKNFFINNPFIPVGHELFYLKGVIAGFDGDYLTANHLLVPQIENSLRHLMKLNEKEPSSLHPSGSQERNGLKYVLEDPFIIDLLGEDIVFNLKAILIDEVYGGIRHKLSHGYIPANFFYSYHAVYSWWLTLYILMIPFSQKWKDKYEKTK